MVFIYVLKCEREKYYVGKTSNPNFRLAEHMAGSASQWTTRFKPLRLIELKPSCDRFDEDKVTKQYMSKYGVMNVRGGSYTQIALGTDTVNHLQREINGANDKCFLCGRNDHFVSECPLRDWEELQDADSGCERCGRNTHLAGECFATTHVNGGLCHSVSKAQAPRSPAKWSMGETCSRCGRKTHISDECYATTHVNGGPCKVVITQAAHPRAPIVTELVPPPQRSADSTCSRCGRKTHRVSECYAIIHVNGGLCGEASQPLRLQAPRATETRTADGACLRCGRTTHWASECYAITHVNGGLCGEASQPLRLQAPRATETRTEGGACSRCGRKTHRVSECYATTHVNGGLCGEASQPLRLQAPRATETRTADGACLRCGRTTHWASECYATTHVNGGLCGGAKRPAEDFDSEDSDSEDSDSEEDRGYGGSKTKKRFAHSERWSYW